MVPENVGDNNNNKKRLVICIGNGSDLYNLVSILICVCVCADNAVSSILKIEIDLNLKQVIY